MTIVHDAARRRFLRIAASASGALVVGFRAGTAGAQHLPVELIGDELARLTAFVMIERDNRVVVGARGCETGQGVITTLPMLIAEELDVDWPQVRVIQLGYGYVEVDGTPANLYGSQAAISGSTLGAAWAELRKAGAIARALLVQAAANAWQLPPDVLRTGSGRVIAPDGRTLSYGAIARSAADLSPAGDDPALKDAIDFRIIGKPTRTVDARNVVTGRTRYASDEFLSGALVAVILRCPFLDGTLESFDATDARKVPGVREVIALEGAKPGEPPSGPLAAGIAVLADATWAALQGRAALKVVWKQGPWADESSAALAAKAHALLDADDEGLVVRKDGDFAGSRTRARHQLAARYEMPFLAHATMEPPGALVELRQDGALLIAALEDPDGASRMLSELTGLPRTAIDIRLPRAGGGFGRRLENDFVAEAVQVAKLAGKAVKLVWTRADDLAHDAYRPFGVHALAATLDRRNRVAGWSQRCAATPRNDRDPALQGRPAWLGCVGADDFPAGLVEHFEKSFLAIESGMPRGALRGSTHAFDAFAVQSFIDEIAFEVRRDAVALRLEMLGEPRLVPGSGPGATDFDTARMAHVLKLCADRIQWGTKRSDGRGVGIACHFAAGGYAAHAFETSMDGETLRIHRAVCVVDVGRAINPLGLEAQMIGGTIDGLSTALNLAITVRDGQVQQRDFSDYRLLGMARAPARVEVQIVESAHEPVDTGDVAVASVAPALANAIFATTTVRIRKLPLLPELMRLL